MEPPSRAEIQRAVKATILGLALGVVMMLLRVWRVRSAGRKG